MHSQLVVLGWVRDGEEQTVVPGALAVLVTEVSVGVLTVVSVEEASDEAVGCTLTVHHLEFLGVPDDDTHLEVFSRLLGDVPLRSGIF